MSDSVLKQILYMYELETSKDDSTKLLSTVEAYGLFHMHLNRLGDILKHREDSSRGGAGLDRGAISEICVLSLRYLVQFCDAQMISDVKEIMERVVDSNGEVRPVADIIAERDGIRRLLAQQKSAFDRMHKDRDSWREKYLASVVDSDGEVRPVADIIAERDMFRRLLAQQKSAFDRSVEECIEDAIDEAEDNMEKGCEENEQKENHAGGIKRFRPSIKK